MDSEYAPRRFQTIEKGGRLLCTLRSCLFWQNWTNGSTSTWISPNNLHITPTSNQGLFIYSNLAVVFMVLWLESHGLLLLCSCKPSETSVWQLALESGTLRPRTSHLTASTLLSWTAVIRCFINTQLIYPKIMVAGVKPFTTGIKRATYHVSEHAEVENTLLAELSSWQKFWY
jgi:hypothetical protein